MILTYFIVFTLLLYRYDPSRALLKIFKNGCLCPHLGSVNNGTKLEKIGVFNTKKLFNTCIRICSNALLIYQNNKTKPNFYTLKAALYNHWLLVLKFKTSLSKDYQVKNIDYYYSKVASTELKIYFLIPSTDYDFLLSVLFICFDSFRTFSTFFKSIICCVQDDAHTHHVTA